MRSYQVTHIKADGTKTTYPSLKVAAASIGMSRFTLQRLAITGQYHTDGSRFVAVHSPNTKRGWRMVSLMLEPVVYDAFARIAEQKNTSMRALSREIIIEWMATQPGVVVEQATVVEG